MNTSSLRRTALLAAAVASLSLPAAAQTDAAFAAALGKLPSGLATMAQLKTQAQKPAAAAVPAQGPTAPADIWKKVIARIRRDGVREFPDSAEQTLIEITGDRDAAHETHIAMAFLALDDDDNTVVSAVALVSGKVTPAPSRGMMNNVRWELHLSDSGQVEMAFVVKSYGNADYGFDEVSRVEISLADPIVKVRLDEMLKRWSGR